MDYYIFADGSFVAEPSRESLSECRERIAVLGAKRMVWPSTVKLGEWHEVRAHIRETSYGDAASIPAEVKLAHMLE